MNAVRSGQRTHRRNGGHGERPITVRCTMAPAGIRRRRRDRRCNRLSRFRPAFKLRTRRRAAGRRRPSRRVDRGEQHSRLARGRDRSCRYDWAPSAAQRWRRWYAKGADCRVRAASTEAVAAIEPIRSGRGDHAFPWGRSHADPQAPAAIVCVNCSEGSTLASLAGGSPLRRAAF